jgi:hypothetical protein
MEVRETTSWEATVEMTASFAVSGSSLSANEQYR